jgi:hypothetical protein
MVHIAETTEQLGGCFLIDVAHLDEAITVAGRFPAVSRARWKFGPWLSWRSCLRAISWRCEVIAIRHLNQTEQING